MTTAKRLLGLVGVLCALAIAPVQAQTEVVLHSFSGPAGSFPYSGVARDPAGNLYGTARAGGAAKKGVVYKLDPARHYMVLHSFTGADGASPEAGVALDSVGNLYGTTYSGGAAGFGVVYKLSTSGQETILYNFTGGAEGGFPQGGVIFDPAGNLYGTAGTFGTGGYGAVYEIDAAGNYTVLYSFTGQADGGYPYAGVIRDSAGDLYGTTYFSSPPRGGTVYKLDTPGQETVLYHFTLGADGGQPEAGVIRNSAGNLYGTTAHGGPAQAGVVFKVDLAGDETVLYTFTGGADGGDPYAGVIRDPTGNLYGTTSAGGASGAGVVYKLDTAGNYTVLHSFTGGEDGAYPRAGLLRDANGKLQGTTEKGGKNGHGVIFEIKP